MLAESVGGAATLAAWFLIPHTTTGLIIVGVLAVLCFAYALS